MNRYIVIVALSIVAASVTVLGAAGRDVAAASEKVLYAFTGGTDGGGPQSSLVFDSSGTLYGTTHFGGVSTCGGMVGGGCGVSIVSFAGPILNWPRCCRSSLGSTRAR